MKGKTKAILFFQNCRYLLLCGNTGDQHSFIGDMVFYHDLSGDPGCSVSGKKEIEQI